MRAIPVTLSAVPILLIALSACAMAPPAASLADAKSLVQLVRNEAGARIAAGTTAELAVVDDVSEACDPDDSEGRERRWTSTSLVTLDPAAGDSLESIYGDLIDSFSANGWSEVSYGGRGAVSLRKPESDASLEFVADSGDTDTNVPATITVTISSGCVQTAGAESDEVATLEKAGA